MAYKMKIFIFFHIFLIHFSLEDNNAAILCTESFCKEYVLKNPCPEFSENCKIQNATHNGLVLPSPVPCNCCKFCVDNLGLGDTCIIGEPDGPLAEVICGDMLFCDKDTKKCVTKLTPCVEEQVKYQNKKNDGTLGFLELKPQCDKRGDYLPIKCIPGEICFCVNKKGDRIFGEMPYNIQAADITKCGCSSIIDTINKVLNENNYTPKRPKCLSDGNYDSIQCVNKNCICVHKLNGIPSIPDQVPVNIHLVSSMPCYDNSSHPEGVYLNACEREYNQILDNIEYNKELGFDLIIGYKFPSCQLDGHYAAVQETKTEKYCADPNGKQLENFKVSKTDDDNLSKTMNCNCARSRSIIPWFGKPDCCKNGNYVSLQCRRGKCYCVDTNGIQIEKEVPFEEKEKLSCDSEKCTKLEE